MQKYITDFSLQAFPIPDLVSLILPNLKTTLEVFGAHFASCSRT
jgi:hypothetical protein